MTEEKLKDILITPPSNISNGPFFEPPPAMKHYPQCIVVGDSIKSYQSYYREAKSHFARWTNRQVPEFMV